MKYYDMQRTAERLRILRRRQGLTQEQVADAVNVDRNTIGRIERGVMACSVDMFINLSELYGASIDYLITGQTYQYSGLEETLDTVISQLTALRQSL